MMDNYTGREVREALEPYHDKIRGAILEGYAEYLAVERFRAKNNFGPQLYPRTGANDVFDAVARNARAVFGVEPGVRVIDETQTVKFFFGGKVIGRFKKGDDGHLGRNVPTQASLSFIDPQQDIPGLPSAAAKVEFVYEANDIGTEIETILVVSRDRDRLLWSYPIEGRADMSGVFVLPKSPAPGEDRPLIRPKPHKKDAKDAKGE